MCLKAKSDGSLGLEGLKYDPKEIGVGPAPSPREGHAEDENFASQDKSASNAIQDNTAQNEKRDNFGNNTAPTTDNSDQAEVATPGKRASLISSIRYLLYNSLFHILDIAFLVQEEILETIRQLEPLQRHRSSLII